MLERFTHLGVESVALIKEPVELVALQSNEDARRQSRDRRSGGDVGQQRDFAKIIAVGQRRNANRVVVLVGSADCHLATNDDMEAAAFVTFGNYRATRGNVFGAEHRGDVLQTILVQILKQRYIAQN